MAFNCNINFNILELESFSAADNLKSNTSHKLSYTPATSQSPKLSLGTSQTKKRGKPMKLGSSLSRKSSEGKVAVRIGYVYRYQSVTDCRYIPGTPS